MGYYTAMKMNKVEVCTITWMNLMGTILKEDEIKGAHIE